MNKIICFDVGDRRIGVAVSDALGFTAQGIGTHTRGDDPAADAAALLETARKNNCTRLLFGLPRNMDGSYGFQAEKVKEFAALMTAHWEGTYDFFDERLTTVSAERVLLEADVSRKKRKQVVDKIAATFILQGYLDAGGADRPGRRDQ